MSLGSRYYRSASLIKRTTQPLETAERLAKWLVQEERVDLVRTLVLEATQGQIDSLSGQLPFQCDLEDAECHLWDVYFIFLPGLPTLKHAATRDGRAAGEEAGGGREGRSGAYSPPGGDPGANDGFFRQLLFKCHLPEVAFGV